jgi:hypothetical protein
LHSPLLHADTTEVLAWVKGDATGIAFHLGDSFWKY